MKEEDSKSDFYEEDDFKSYNDTKSYKSISMNDIKDDSSKLFNMYESVKDDSM